MSDEVERRAVGQVELVADGDGLAVLGEKSAVEAFLATEGLASSSFSLPSSGGALAVGSSAVQAASSVNENAGRWVKLTQESSRAIEKYGLRESKATGNMTGVVKGDSGRVRGFVEFARAPGATLRNPAALAGIAGVMAQLAMKQSMDEIAGYLERIEGKVDDVLRAHRDAVVADLVGVELAIDEAYRLSTEVGRVSDITWSKISDAPMMIGRTQAYVLRQLNGLTTKLDGSTKVGDLADIAAGTAAELQEWLSVLARTVQLHEAIGVLELERVLADSPDDHLQHALSLRDSRAARRDAIASVTDRLALELDEAAERANKRVLRHPSSSPEVVAARNRAVGALRDFNAALGLENARDFVEARRWKKAFGEASSRAIDATGSAARDVGQQASARARAFSETRRLPRPRRSRSDD